MVDLSFDIFKIVVFEEGKEFPLNIGGETGFANTFLHFVKRKVSLSFVIYEEAEVIK